MTRLPRRPGSTLVLTLNQKPSMTSSFCSCHHAARTRLRWPPGPSNEAYLSCPYLEASPAMTFRACSSPAPTPVKPQPAPAIHSQELVHTMLSITHHTRKRPSIRPRTRHWSSTVKLYHDGAKSRLPNRRMVAIDDIK
jgi:hypothetical protein